MKIKTFTLSGLEYYKKHLEVLNSLLPVKMTQTEMDIIAILLNRNIQEIEDDLLSTNIRKKLRVNLKLSHANLSTRIKQLKEKGFIDIIDGKYKLKSFLFPNPIGTTVYKIIIKNEESLQQ